MFAVILLAAKFGCVPAPAATGGTYNPRLFPCHNGKTCYVRQDGVTVETQPGLVNRTAGLGGAHGVGVHDARGVLNEIGSECTPSHTEDMPARPGASAGTIPQAWWDTYWTGANKNLYRCNLAFPAGRLVGMPPPVDPRWKLCDSLVTPIPTNTASPTQSSPTSTASPTSSPTVTSSPTATTSPSPVRTVIPVTQTRIPITVPPRPTASSSPTIVPPSPSPSPDPTQPPVVSPSPTPTPSCWFCGCRVQSRP